MAHKVEKVRARSVRVWLRITENQYGPNPRSMFLPASSFDTNQAAAFRCLADEGFGIPGRKARANFIEELAACDLVEDRQFIDEDGWQGDCFVLADGRYHSPAGAGLATIAFAERQGPPLKAPPKVEKPKLIRLLKKQPALQFIFLASLAPLIARIGSSVDDVLIEIAGGDDRGRAIIVEIACAAFQDTYGSRGGTSDVASLVDGDLEEGQMQHDRLAVVTDMGLWLGGETPAQRTTRVKRLGQSLRSRKSAHFTHARWVLSVSPHSLLEPVNDHVLKRELRESIVTITPPKGGWHSATGSQPDVRAGADVMRKAIASARGQFGRVFIQKLVDDRANNPDKLNATIERERRRFIDEHASANLPSAILDMFATVSAVGAVAYEAELIPSSWCRSVSLVLRDLREDAMPAFEAVLQGIADDPATVRINGAIKPSRHAIEGAAALLKANGKRTELLIRPERVDELIPKWSAYERTAGCKALNKRDKRHATTKRVLTGKPERVLCFRLPRTSSSGAIP